MNNSRRNSSRGNTPPAVLESSPNPNSQNSMGSGRNSATPATDGELENALGEATETLQAFSTEEEFTALANRRNVKGDVPHPSRDNTTSTQSEEEPVEDEDEETPPPLGIFARIGRAFRRRKLDAATRAVAQQRRPKETGEARARAEQIASKAAEREARADDRLQEQELLLPPSDDDAPRHTPLTRRAARKAAKALEKGMPKLNIQSNAEPEEPAHPAGGFAMLSSNADANYSGLNFSPDSPHPSRLDEPDVLSTDSRSPSRRTSQHASFGIPTRRPSRAPSPTGTTSTYIPASRFSTPAPESDNNLLPRAPFGSRGGTSPASSAGGPHFEHDDSATSRTTLHRSSSESTTPGAPPASPSSMQWEETPALSPTNTMRHTPQHTSVPSTTPTLLPALPPTTGSLLAQLKGLRTKINRRVATADLKQEHLVFDEATPAYFKRPLKKGLFSYKSEAERLAIQLNNVITTIEEMPNSLEARTQCKETLEALQKNIEKERELNFPAGIPTEIEDFINVAKKIKDRVVEECKRNIILPENTKIVEASHFDTSPQPPDERVFTKIVPIDPAAERQQLTLEVDVGSTATTTPPFTYKLERKANGHATAVAEKTITLSEAELSDILANPKQGITAATECIHSIVAMVDSVKQSTQEGKPIYIHNAPNETWAKLVMLYARAQQYEVSLGNDCKTQFPNLVNFLDLKSTKAEAHQLRKYLDFNNILSHNAKMAKHVRRLAVPRPWREQLRERLRSGKKKS